MKLKVIAPAVAVGCLIVCLTAGFISSENSNRILAESEFYRMEASRNTAGVTKEADEVEEKPVETESPAPAPFPVITSEPGESSTSGGTGNIVSAWSSTLSQQSSIGTEIENDSGIDEDGRNTNSGGSTTYKEYIGMSVEEKQAIAGQFSSPDEYFNWVDSLAQANADAEAERTYSGSVNIDETFGNN